jgi:hypothetical protein
MKYICIKQLEARLKFKFKVREIAGTDRTTIPELTEQEWKCYECKRCDKYYTLWNEYEKNYRQMSKL